MRCRFSGPATPAAKSLLTRRSSALVDALPCTSFRVSTGRRIDVASCSCISDHHSEPLAAGATCISGQEHPGSTHAQASARRGPLQERQIRRAGRIRCDYPPGIVPVTLLDGTSTKKTGVKRVTSREERPLPTDTFRELSEKMIPCCNCESSGGG